MQKEVLQNATPPCNLPKAILGLGQVVACGRVMEGDGRTLMVPPHAPPPSEGDCLRHCDNSFLFCNRPRYYAFGVFSPAASRARGQGPKMFLIRQRSASGKSAFLGRRPRAAAFCCSWEMAQLRLSVTAAPAGYSPRCAAHSPGRAGAAIRSGFSLPPGRERPEWRQ